MKIVNVVMLLCIAIVSLPLSTGAGTVNENRYVLYLEQNYPNPFDTATSIEYEITCPSDSCVDSVYVRLSVYNVLSHIIDTLVSGYQYINTCYSMLWDGRDGKDREQSAGVYFYQLHVAGQTCTKKMILLR